MKGHTSASAAAELAKRAGARRLVLVHLPPHSLSGDLARAREVFPALELGEDLARYEL
ncbi:ribonuclease Z [compost metagenome]